MININEVRLEYRLNALAEFGRDPGGGWSRFSFTPPYENARQLLKEWMEEIGMSVSIDSAGNMIGRLEGQDPNLPVIAVGSHIDTVKCGGKYDGNLGVLSGLEALASIVESGIDRPSPMELLIFLEEEGARFGGSLFGSRCLVGNMDPEALKNFKDSDGVSMWDAFYTAGLDPTKIKDCIKPEGYYKCYFELHIEQGAVLETSNKVLGIVQGISAPRWFKVILDGRADHAGATPMHLRKDALVAAAKIIEEVESIVKAASINTVGTVGKILVSPCSMNAVPGKVEMIFDVRDIDIVARDTAINKINSYIATICKIRDIKYTITDMVNVEPAIVPDNMVKVIEKVANELDVPFTKMISGAGHDAQLMANITDIAMIFTPSIAGLSHCPEEDTKIEDIHQCTKVLTQCLARML